MIKQAFKQMLKEARVNYEELAKGFIIEATEEEAMQLENIVLWCRNNCYRIDEGINGLFYDYSDDKEDLFIEIYLKRED